jgi:phage terminase Nu1 subunit (DNA packaging protein)|tara:strand:+ start:307 stop:846 length:540 start_codon:yes stop_codon:yes gene_type:complete
MADRNTYPIAVIASVLDLSERHIRRLADDGVIPKPQEKGRWDLIKCVRGYVRFLRERAFGKEVAATDLHSERTRLAKAQADRIEIEVGEMRGEYIQVEWVVECWQHYTANAKSKLLGVPSKTASLVIAAKDFGEAEQIIKVEITEALTELSNDGLPDKFRKRVEQSFKDMDTPAIIESE